MEDSNWSSPAVAANSYTGSCIVYCLSDYNCRCRYINNDNGHLNCAMPQLGRHKCPTPYTNCVTIDTEAYTLRKLYFQFLSYRMGYDRVDSFPLDIEPNGIPSIISYSISSYIEFHHIPFYMKGNGNLVFSVHSLKTLMRLEQLR